MAKQKHAKMSGHVLEAELHILKPVQNYDSRRLKRVKLSPPPFFISVVLAVLSKYLGTLRRGV